MGKTKRKLNLRTGFFNKKKRLSCDWPRRQEPASRFARSVTRNNISGKTEVIGSVSLSFVIMFFIVLAGVVYIYSINSSAVKGFEMRKAEKEVTGLKKENESLIIKEAELKSLYNIEEASKKLNMEQLGDISYINENSPVAMK